jgi:hypothetical protein
MLRNPKLLFIFLIACALAYAQQVLNNESIVKMVRAGLSDDVIVSMVQSQPGKYAVGPDDLIALKNASVSARVINTLVKKSSGDQPEAAPELPAASSDSGTGRPTVTLGMVRKIYIEKMSNNLDQYLRAEFTKQLRGRVEVVLEPKDADGILTGISDEEKGTGAKITGRYLGLHDVATGTISLLDRDRKTILWSDEAGDRSLMFGMMKRGGERKVADRLVGKLKKALTGK